MLSPLNEEQQTTLASGKYCANSQKSKQLGQNKGREQWLILLFVMLLVALFAIFPQQIVDFLKSGKTQEIGRQSYVRRFQEEVEPQIYHHVISDQEQSPRLVLNISLSEEELQKIIHNMKNPSHRPSVLNTNKSLKYIDDVYFAYTLSNSPENKEYHQAQFYNLNKKYGISKVGSQLPMCIVMVGRNIRNNIQKLYESIRRQNYTNYHIVHIDDNSDDNTKQSVVDFLNKQENQDLLKRTIFIEQTQKQYALYNRDLAISKYCHNSEIVVDIDSDDWLIGNQVFQLVNTLYQTDPDELWLLYLNHIIWSPKCKCPLPGNQGQIDQKIIQQKQYRISGGWRSTQLRTFLKKLYSKIDKDDFKDKHGSYYHYKSDNFIHYSLVELAAPKHMKIYDQFVYFYDTSFNQPSFDHAVSRLASKIITPYQTLKSLEENSKKITNYSPPKYLYQQFKVNEAEYFGEI